MEYVNHILSALWNKYLKNDENIVLKDPKKNGKERFINPALFEIVLNRVHFFHKTGSYFSCFDFSTLFKITI